MVSIITVNYNGLADTCEMIASFRKHETHPYEIIVVDNGSRMPEADEIKLRHPEVKVVQNTNTGFAGGNNAGLTVAEGNYLFFLNNDTIIKEPILETLIHRLETDPPKRRCIAHAKIQLRTRHTTIRRLYPILTHHTTQCRHRLQRKRPAQLSDSMRNRLPAWRRHDGAS